MWISKGKNICNLCVVLVCLTGCYVGAFKDPEQAQTFLLVSSGIGTLLVGQMTAVWAGNRDKVRAENNPPKS